jgi:hypothetical protein
MVPSIQKTAEGKARYAAITDAFDCIRGASNAYSDCWLKAEDWLLIICAEYDLIVADINFTASDVQHALNKGKYKLATPSTPSNGVFRDDYKRQDRGCCHCYFVEWRIARPNAAIHNVKSFSNPTAKVCSIEKLKKDRLAKILGKNYVVETVESSTVKETPSQLSGGNDRGEGVTNTRTDAAELSAHGIGDALNPPHGASGEGVPNMITDAPVLSAHGIGDALDPPHGYSGGAQNKRKRIAPDITSPHAMGLRLMAPANSGPVLERRQEHKRALWTMEYADEEGEKPPGESSIRTKACHLEQYLLCQGNSNGTTVVEILLATLKRATMADIFKKLVSKLDGVVPAEDVILLDRQRDFIQHHSSEGQRTKVVQNAIDAVVTASVWTKEEDKSDTLPNIQEVVTEDDSVSIRKVSNRLGVPWKKVKACSARASHFIRVDEKYCPYKNIQRSDCSREAAYNAIQEFCHCNESSNLDTESYCSIKVKDPYSGEVEPHPFRVWHEMTLKDRYNGFLDSSVFRKFKEAYPQWSIGREVFRQLMCKCVRNPGPQSCVDLHMSQLKHYMSALDQAMRSNPAIKQRVDTCDDCERHRLERDDSEESPVMWESFLSGRPVDLIQSSCCKRREEPLLCYEVGRETPPRMLRWGCTHKKSGPRPTQQQQEPLTSTASPSEEEQDDPLVPGQDCGNCGVEKLLRISECPALRDCKITIPVWEWKLADRAGFTSSGKQNQQNELTEGAEPVDYVLSKFIEQLEICRKHHAEMEWLRIARKTDIWTFGPDEMVILTDFSATMDFRASQTANSSVDSHGALQIFVVLHSPRVVKLIDKNGVVQGDKRVHECDVWYFFGATMSKGKKNDHVFHNACLEEIVNHYQAKRSRDNGTPLTRIRIWTDNCGSQYKCRHNFWKIATFPSRVAGVEVWHRFAQKYDFKGVWDAAGKVVKQKIRTCEIERKKRFPTAWSCFVDLPLLLGKLAPKTDWKQLEREKDPKLLQKGIFVNSNRYFGYVSDIKEEYQLERNNYRHVVYADRENVPSTKRVDDTLKLHSVCGGREGRLTAQLDGTDAQEWKLRVAFMPCVCRSCRGEVDEQCPFIDLRNERDMGEPRQTAGTSEKC